MMLRALWLTWLSAMAIAIPMVQVVVFTSNAVGAINNNNNNNNYFQYAEDLYNGQGNSSNIHSWLIDKDLVSSLTVTDETCASGGAYRGSRIGGANETFIYLNGDGIPNDAVSIAGVFDFQNDLEIAVIRGMRIYIAYLHCNSVKLK